MQKFDVVIIGSGIGGLVCADILGKEGYSVCVIEKNKQLGGCLQTYSREKTIFDSGVHYIGGLDKGQNMYQIFKYLGIMDDLKLQKLDEDGFDKILIDNDENVYSYAQGYDNFIAGLVKFFPEEETAIRTYCDKILEICGKFPLYNLRSSIGYEENASVLEIDTKEYIDSITTNEKLRVVLAGNNALYAGEPGKTPLYVHALILNSYIESSYKCVDGGGQIAKLLAKSIRKNNGDFIRDKEVIKIVEENGLVEYVELADNTRVYGKEFISNIHPAKTIQILQTDMLRAAFKKRVINMENSTSSFTINIVLKKNSFKYLKHNFYCHKDGHVWTAQNYTEENWPLGYAMFLSASSKSTEFADAMSILTYMRIDDVKPWADTFNTTSDENSRGEDYEHFKIRKAEILLDSVEHKFPGLRDCIQSYTVATPLSFRDYIGNDDGSLYGVTKDYKDPLRTFLSPKTKIPNLFLTGQNLNLHGILGASMSGLKTCFAILGNDNIIEKIKNA